MGRREDISVLLARLRAGKLWAQEHFEGRPPFKMAPTLSFTQRSEMVNLGYILYNTSTLVFLVPSVAVLLK